MNEKLLRELVEHRETVLGRITDSHLRRYDTLQRTLHATDVSADREYQKLFNGFYRMQRRRAEWYKFFFSMLQEEKNNNSVTFGHVLETVYRHQHRVEPSFSSKLVATIRPDMPVYDRYVRENLELSIPKAHLRADRRIQMFAALYVDLQTKLRELVRTDRFRELEAAFDQRFPAYTHFTDVKKLDLFLWQHRRMQQQDTREQS